MSYSRRDFLKTSGIVSAGLFTLNPLTAHKAWAATADGSESIQVDTLNFTGNYAIHQGLTVEDTVYVNILRPRDAALNYEVVDSQNRIQSYIIVSSFTVRGSAWQLDKVKIFDLKLTETYRLRVVDAKNKVVDERTFKTLDTQKRMPKIAIASCMNDSFDSARIKMWNKMQSVKPDLIFLVGDTCYADNDSDGTQLGFMNRYVETRNALAIFRQKTLTPILATWDDHDFGGNNFDSSFGNKLFTKELFSAFWLYPEHDKYRRGVGVSQAFYAFGQKFHLMDDRYYRTDKTQWGTEQESLLYKSINKDKAPSWIMNGSQFFGGYLKKDAYEYKQAAHLKQVCSNLSKLESPVAFVSGDVHFSEMMTIEPSLLGYKTFEITSSSIHSFTFLGNHNRKKNPRRINATSKHNFNLITIDNSKPQFKFNVTCHGDDKVLYTQNFDIKRG